MEDTQQKLIDDILQFAYKNECRLSFPFDFKHFIDKGYSDWSIHIVIDMLKSDYRFIYNYDDSVSVFILTNSGKKAAKIGIIKYLNQLEKEKSYPKKAFFISILALIFAAIQPSISLLEKTIPNQQIGNRDQDGSNRNDNTKDTQKNIIIDSLTIEKIKYSLKHDTIFINELTKKNKK